MELLGKLAARGLIALAFVSAMLAGTMILHHRGAATQAASAYESVPIPVATVVAEFSDAYEIAERFVGRLEPAQEARVAFERSGFVTAVLVEEGQQVNAGEILATLDMALLTADLERLSAQKLQTLADLELSRRTEKRQRSLQRKGHASAQKLDEARFGTEALVAGLARIEAEIHRVGIEVGKSTLHAPFTGIVGTRHLDNGSTVDAGTAVLDLLESGRPRARIGLSPIAAVGLNPGDPVTLRYEDRTLSGRVYSVRADLTSATRTVGVLIDILDPSRVVFGDTVRLEVSRPINSEGFWLPVSALTEGVKGLWTVFTLKPGPNSALRVGRESVEILHVVGDRAYVRGTIRVGQRIISEGINRIVVGQTVEPAPEGA